MESKGGKCQQTLQYLHTFIDDLSQPIKICHFSNDRDNTMIDTLDDQSEQ